MSSQRKSQSGFQITVPGRNWVQAGIVAAALVLSIAAAYWGSIKVHILLLVALAGTGSLLALLYHPPLGLILIMVAGMFIPFKGPGGLNASILSVILVFALWLLDMFVVKREFRFVRSRALRPAVLFMGVCILAFALGQIPWFIFANQAPLDAQIGGFAIYFFLLGSMVMTAHLISDIRWLKGMLWLFTGLGYAYVFGRVLGLSFIDKLFQHGVYANSIFWMLLICLPLSQAIFNHDLKPRLRILLFVLVGSAFYVGMTQQGDWKSGWVPAAAAAGVLAALRFKRLIPLAIPVGIAIAAYLSRDLISTDLYSWGTRLDAWIIVLQISKVSPIIGMGFANYYWYAPLFPIRGYAIRFNSHSQYVDIIAQTGILGLLCFFWLLYEVGRLAWRLGKELPDGFSKAYSHGIFAGIFGALMASFLVDWLLPFAYNIGLEGARGSVMLWIFFGGLVSLEQMHIAGQKSAVELAPGETNALPSR